MVIDGHAHACGDFVSAGNIVKILDENGVDKVVLVPGAANSNKTWSLPKLAWRFPNRDVVSFTNRLTRLSLLLSGNTRRIPDGNPYVHSLAQAAPDRIVQFFWAQPGKPATLDQMESQYSEWGFKGIKLQQCWDRFQVRSEAFERLVRFATKYDLPIFIHAGAYDEVKALIACIDQHPEAKFIIGHLYGLELFIQSGKKPEQVYFEISNTYLVSTARVIRAIQYFGAHKIILGSDTPYGKQSLRLNIERVRALPITDEEKKKILGENMQALMK